MELVQALFHGLGLGLELRQVRLELGDHLGFAPIAAPEPVMSATATAAAVFAMLSAAAALAAGAILALRMAFAAMAAMMSMMLVFACLAAAHDQPLFRRLAERCPAMDSYSARNSSRCVLVLRISAAQASRCSRPIFVSS